MNRRHIFGASAFVFALALSFTPSCNGGDCASLCTEAQQGNCTSIKGDCTKACDAAEAIRLDSGCGTQEDAYIDCLNQGPVCEQSCSSRENDYGTCVIAYCLKHSADANCQTIVAAFQ
jgi:hypothetical protein